MDGLIGFSLLFGWCCCSRICYEKLFCDSFVAIGGLGASCNGARLRRLVVDSAWDRASVSFNSYMLWIPLSFLAGVFSKGCSFATLADCCFAIPWTGVCWPYPLAAFGSLAGSGSNFSSSLSWPILGDCIALFVSIVWLTTAGSGLAANSA